MYLIYQRCNAASSSYEREVAGIGCCSCQNDHFFFPIVPMSFPMAKGSDALGFRDEPFACCDFVFDSIPKISPGFPADAPPVTAGLRVAALGLLAAEGTTLPLELTLEAVFCGYCVGFELGLDVAGL